LHRVLIISLSIHSIIRVPELPVSPRMSLVVDPCVAMV
jgi:hypothetical protein